VVVSEEALGPKHRSQLIPLVVEGILEFKSNSHFSPDNEDDLQHFVSLVKDNVVVLLCVDPRDEIVAHQFQQLVLGVSLGLEEGPEVVDHVIKHVVNNQRAFQLVR